MEAFAPFKLSRAGFRALVESEILTAVDLAGIATTYAEAILRGLL